VRLGGTWIDGVDAQEARVLLRGQGTSRARATGPVRIVASPSEADRLRPGDVLVARMTSPGWEEALGGAAAIVTEFGGVTSHAAIVCRRLGIPGIVGAHDATTVLSEGQRVTVDAAAGEVLAIDRTTSSAPEG
jgi:pyruvate,water dikinase